MYLTTKGIQYLNPEIRPDKRSPPHSKRSPLTKSYVPCLLTVFHCNKTPEIGHSGLYKGHNGNQYGDTYENKNKQKKKKHMEPSHEM